MNTDESHIVTRSRRPALLDISNREANMNLDNGLDKVLSCNLLLFYLLNGCYRPVDLRKARKIFSTLEV